MDTFLSLALYGLPFAAILGFYLWRQNRVHARHRRVHEESIAAGMTEPASLHPLIDASKFLGCPEAIGELHHLDKPLIHTELSRFKRLAAVVKPPFTECANSSPPLPQSPWQSHSMSRALTDARWGTMSWT